MNDYILSCCSTVDVTEDFLRSRDIEYVYFNYNIDGEACHDDFGRTNSPATLYARMLAGADVVTSQVSVGEYQEFWRPFLEAGKDVLHVTLSSGISGTYNSACTARDLLKDEYPNQKIVVVDSLCASSGYGMLMDRLADLRREGMGLEELAAWARQHRQEVQHWFFSSDLTFFVRGGRISKVAGVAGGLLRICPVMDVAPDGSLAVIEKIRTKAKAERRVVDIMRATAFGGERYTGRAFLCNSECADDARDVATMVEQAFPQMDGHVQVFDIGATIGCHTGPGTVALFFWGDAAGRKSAAR
ncbi:DegV family protein [Parafannyhessea sp. LCP21S3_E6]|uniref:DegV family protein n=1 Tax=unclassified Parafannyhessea TaxID=2847323 RepID=UPI003F99345C